MFFLFLPGQPYDCRRFLSSLKCWSQPTAVQEPNLQEPNNSLQHSLYSKCRTMPEHGTTSDSFSWHLLARIHGLGVRQVPTRGQKACCTVKDGESYKETTLLDVSFISS